MATRGLIRRGLVSPTGKAVTLPAVRPNEGVTLTYRRRLERLIDVMHASLVYWLKAGYRANPPELAPELAQDASPAMTLRDLMNRLAHRWQRRFDDAAPLLARAFADSTLRCADNAFRAKLKDAGFAVEFHLSREANDAMQATIGENVALIKSIASQHLAEVQGLVMRSVQTGRDIGGLTKDLQTRYQMTKRRAAFIAHDQNSKATATITRVRQEGLGITEAIWLHSHGGRHPRASHLAADGKRYRISEGMYLDGAWTWPGREPNCRCVSRSVIPALDQA